VGILAALEKGLGIKAETGSRIAAAWADYEGAEASHSGRWTDLSQAYRVHPWVHAGVKAIARAAADVPLRVIRVQGGTPKSLIAYKSILGIKRWEDVLERVKAEGGEVLENHPLLSVLENPLPEAHITRHEFLEAIVTYLELEGVAYAEKIFADQAKRTLRGLWPYIDPRHIWVIPGEDKLVQGYIYRRGANAIVFASDEIVAFKYFHPENPYYGLAPTEVLRQALIADLRAIDWNRMFFDNDATPGGVLSTEQDITPAQSRAMRALWEERYRGPRKAHRTAVLGKGLKYQPVSPSHRDMGFLELRGWTREEVLAVYGVPPIVVGLYKDVNRAAAQTMRRLFYENTVLPRLGKIESVLNYALVPDGENVRLVFDVSAIEALQEDVTEKARVGRLLTDQGWTKNELRNWWGKPRAEGDLVDAVILPINVQAAGTVAPQKSFANKSIVKDKPAGGVPEAFLPPESESLEDQRRVHISFLPILALLGAKHAVNTLGDLGHPVPIDWEERFNFIDAIQHWIDQRMGKLIKGIDEVTRRDIVRVIREGMREGEGPKAIASRIRRRFDWMSTVRAERIARTEAGAATAFGQHKLYKDVGIQRHMWIATLDMRVRDWHMQIHHQERPMDQPFEVPNENGDIEQMMHPRDGSLGASASNIINCRCTEAPVIEGAKINDEEYWKEFDVFLLGVEQGEGHKYQEELAAFFRREGDRYVRYFLEMAGEGGGA